jgi:putative phosphoribosyl transferase
MIFRDRFQAGRMLAKKLEHLKNDPNVLILALPRGGVPVAYEIASILNLPLDILIVRKLGVPGHEELAMGAIANGGEVVLNQDIIFQSAIGESQVAEVIKREEAELERRERVYRYNRPPLSISGKWVVLVDDGVATGATIKAAIHSLRAKSPKRLSVAVPVAPLQTIDELNRLADDLVCLHSPEPFVGVGNWYLDFRQTSDSEVLKILRRHAGEYPIEKREQSVQV